MEKVVQNSITDVINQLHHVKGQDRFALLMEHMENLIFDDEDAEEILWVKNLVCEEEEK